MKSGVLLRARRVLRVAIFQFGALLPAQSPVLQTWTLSQDRVIAQAEATEAGAPDAPLSVGSLQKPFVAKAWAAAHPSEATPRLDCDPRSNCWRPAGHGRVGMAQALSQSCNAYFRALAAATPSDSLASVFTAEGFRGKPVTPDLAIGFAGIEGALTIRPADLLEAFARLAREPWPVGEGVRAEVLAGLREAGLQGTAGALGQRGWWAKTGTVPSSDGDATRTAGLVLAVDDGGFAILGRLEPGTGREAAAALAPMLGRLRPGHASRMVAIASAKPRLGRPPAFKPASRKLEGVRVRLLGLLGSSRLDALNLGTSPVPANSGFLGPGAARRLLPGDRLGPGLLEIREPASGFRRRFEGSLTCGRSSKGALVLTAILAPREYVSGVLAAELPHASSERRIELGAAVLRFLAQGPRHAGADVCDSTHCAWFTGRGPRVAWVTPRRAVVERWDRADSSNDLPDGDWAAVQAAALQTGPALWSAHCGGAPLAPHALWGRGDTAVEACPRHGPGNPRPWFRDWKAADLEQAFGAPIRSLRVERLRGTWTLLIESDGDTWSLRYDEAHRRLASVLGWDAMPSPADAVAPIPSGFRARGVGWGHRVGLCLGD